MAILAREQARVIMLCYVIACTEQVSEFVQHGPCTAGDGDAAVYNRVPKAGSTSMTALIRALAEVNMFRTDYQPMGHYHPDDAQLAHDLSKLRAGDVYMASTMPTFWLQRAPTPSTHLRTRSVPSIK